MDVQALLDHARDALTVKRVFGEPIERDGVTIIPVAKVMGGGGGGGGSAPGEPPRSGSVGGFGLRATPAGVYVVRGDAVRWEPALDLNPVILGGQAVALVLLLIVWSILKRRSARD